MDTVTFDTQSAVDELKAAGFTEAQAKANVRVVRLAIEGGVATKADLLEVRHEIEKLQLRMTVLILGTSGALGIFLKFFGA
jgi:hypothetical protein